MATATATISLPKTQGGAFLIEERLPNEIFTPEDLTPEHLAIARTGGGFGLTVRTDENQFPGSSLKRHRLDAFDRCQQAARQ